MRSVDYLNWLEDYWLKNTNRPEFNAYHIYKARWIRDAYPGPSAKVCDAYRKQGGDIRRYFVSIESGLFRDSIPKTRRADWAAEASGALLQASTLDEMRVVAMNYPILLRPAVQGGIDSQLQAYSIAEQTLYGIKFAISQQLREEIEGHPITSRCAGNAE
jgi:hypothetical protein